jgi:CheY-specific phosphatase CheX
MAVKLFGKYLLDKGLVSREDLLQAIALQEQRSPRLGELSLAVTHLDEVNGRERLTLRELALAIDHLQRADVNAALGKEFPAQLSLGELLGELQVMTRNQLNSVITKHSPRHLDLGQALVETGAISEQQLRGCRQEFNQDQARYTAERVDLPYGIANRPGWEVAAGFTRQMIFEVFNRPSSPCTCRRIASADADFMMAAMDLSGDLEGRYIISVSQHLQRVVARVMLEGEPLDGDCEALLEDAVKEFLNVVCGNLAAKYSQLGKVVNISPPVTLTAGSAGLPIPEGHVGLSFPVELGDNERMELILVVKSQADECAET